MGLMPEIQAIQRGFQLDLGFLDPVREVAEDTHLEADSPWGWLPAQPPTNFATWHKSVNLSGPQLRLRFTQDQGVVIVGL